MAVEDLAGGFATPTRTQIRDNWQRDTRLRLPGAPIGEGSQAYQEGSVVADTLLPIYADAIAIANDADVDNKTLAGLRKAARRRGLPEQLPATGGAGFVQISASAGGVSIEVGREIYDERTTLRYQCAATATYVDKQPVAIIGIDTGPATNLPAGTVLKWRNPPPGLNEAAKILPTPDGEGLTGGRDAETAEDIRKRIQAADSDRAAAGNIAHVRELVKEAAEVVGVPVQEVFVYSGIRGPGTYAYCFTLRPARPGGSRAPNATQMAAIDAFITGALPNDDGILGCSVLENPVLVKLVVDWMPKAAGWVDVNPWPALADGFVVTTSLLAATASKFRAVSAAPTPRAPQVGQTCAFYDAKQSKFARKRIGQVTAIGGGTYEITCDTTNNASDTLYVPSHDEPMCPWSESLDLFVAPLGSEFGELGPGEQVDGFFDAGLRQKRVPLNPAEWPSMLRHKMLDGVDDLPQVADVQWVYPPLPYVAPVGTAGVSSNLLTLGRLLVFAS